MSLKRQHAPAPGATAAHAAAPRRHHGKRGAALIIVIAIMTILLAIALTFFTTANIEVRVTTNVSNSVRAEFLQDAASAIAISMLNQDFLNHPEATSLDHPWRSLPSGAAFAGKPWARFNGRPLTEQVINGVRNPGLPEFNFSAIERALNATLYLRFEDGLVEPLFQGGRSKPWLFIPRYQGPSTATGGLNAIVIYQGAVLEDEAGAPIDPNSLNGQLNAAGLYLAYYEGPDTVDSLAWTAREYGFADPTVLPRVTDADVPFVTSPLYGRVEVDGAPAIAAAVNDLDNLQYPAEQLGALVDVDNDGDGQADSMWLPIPSDLYFPQDGIDNNLNGWPDEQQDDNENNDAAFEAGDMAIFNAVTYTEANQGATENYNDADEAIEPAVFVYFAGDDGLDNNSNGLIDGDDPDENGSGANQGLFLTAPLPGLSFYVDLNADGRAFDLVPDDAKYQAELTAAINRGENAVAAAATALNASLTPLRVALPGAIRVLYNGAYVQLGPENVDTIDNDFDLVVNDYTGYCYIGPNTLPGPFRPPFESFFDLDGTFQETSTQDVFNSYLSVYGGTATAAWVTTNLPPADYYETWRSPGNWFQPVPTVETMGGLGTGAGQQPSFADLRNVIGDPVLYTIPRRKAFVEVSADALDINGDGVADITFSPRNLRLLNTNGVNQTYDLNQPGPLLNAVHITVSGEPVCELAGRAAILINDEASKVNLNVAGAHTYNDEYPTRLGARYEGNTNTLSTRDAGPISRASLGEGVSPTEYEIRMLPGIRQINAGRLWAGRVGSPGDGAIARLDAGTANQIPNRTLLTGGTFDPGIIVAGENYALDASLPGYGRTDDNGDALLLAMNGRDDDGDGLIDEGLFLPSLSFNARDTLYSDTPIIPLSTVLSNGDDPTLAPLRLEILRYIEYFNRLGNLEGVDDPGEFQIAKALRNLVAERDAIDNNQDGVIDASSGELGDRVYTDLNIDEISARTGVNVNQIKNLITTFSTDRNANFVETLTAGIRAINKLDFNYATAQQIAAALLVQGDFTPITTRNLTQAPVTSAFAEGLRRGTTHVRAPDPTLPDQGDAATGGLLFASSGTRFLPTTNGPQHAIPADPLLEALQIAVNVKDTVDRAYGRTELITERTDAVSPPFESGSVANWPQDTDLNARERISTANLLVTEDIETYITQVLGLEPRRLQSVDTWWSNLVLADASRGEQRHITYAVAGQEAIRINELMVRPVRRVEAEMVTVVDQNPATPEFDQQTTADFDAANPADPIAQNLIDIGALLRNFMPDPVLDLDGNPGFETDVLPDFNLTRQTLFPALVASGDFTQTTGAPDNWNLIDATGGVGTLNDTLGDAIAFANDAEPFEEFDGPLGPINVPDVIQFMIRGPQIDEDNPYAPPAGLPAGRYYLTINTIDPETGLATITDGDQLDYSIKYVTDAGDNEFSVETTGSAVGTVTDETILGDIYNAAAANDLNNYFNEHFATVPREHVAGNPGTPAYIEGRRPGWVFLDAQPSGVAPTLEGYFLEGAFIADDRGGEAPPLPNRFYIFNSPGTGPDPTAGPTHTVYVPDGNSGITLCIAIKKNNSFPAGARLAINFFDFQQQPDHEYIELTNTSSETVDIGGWKLEVGIPRRADEEEDPNKSKWIVPEGTSVAGGGSLLLGFDVFDGFQEGNGQCIPSYESAIGHNGIGLAGITVPGVSRPLGYAELASVTVPPIADISSLGIDPTFGFGNMFDPDGRFADPTGSVFLRGPDTRFGGIRDYVDRNGDGLSSYFMASENSSAYLDELSQKGGAPAQPYRAIDAVNDDAIRENEEVTSTLYGDTNGDPADSLPSLADDTAKPWDRIVQLINVQVRRDHDTALDNRILPRNAAITLAGANNIGPGSSADSVADFVLRGGFLPDYPEHDGIDNDGDGAYFVEIPPDDFISRCPLVVNPFEYKYVPGTLDKDMVDNDLNGLIDERGAGFDFNGDGCIDLTDPNEIAPDIRLSEGVDEGNLFQNPNVDPTQFDVNDTGLRATRAHGAGSFEAGLLPAVFYSNRPDYDGAAVNFNDALGAPSALVAVPAFIADNNVARVGGRTPNTLVDEAFLAGTPITEEGYYLGCDLDPPDWKAFTERRWNPGDNVIVSLYDTKNAVVDRVTYREYDVINRTIDDVALSPYIDATGQAISLHPSGIAAILPEFMPGSAIAPNNYDGYPSSWRPNHMGLDFYRSLERKDPSYPGDNFGTTNRWEATDGNYDDWADAMPLFRGIVETDQQPAFVAPVLAAFPSSFAPIVTPRIPQPGVVTDNWHRDWARLYRHAIYGSPLRMNLATRLTRNPADLTRCLVDDLPSVNGDEIFNIIQIDRAIGAQNDARPRAQFPSLNAATVFANGNLAETLPNRDWSAYKATGEDTHNFRELPSDITDLFDTGLEEVLLAGTPTENFERRAQGQDLRSTADLLRLPLVARRQDMFNLATLFVQVGDPRLPHIYTPDNPAYERNGAFYRFPIEYVSGVFGRDETDEARGTTLTEAMDLHGSSPVVLSVGQALFTPVAPAEFELRQDSANHPTPSGVTYSDLINFTLGATPTDVIPPHGWSPVYTFELPDDDTTTAALLPPNADALPFYPAYPNGARSGVRVEPHYLFAADYLFPNGAGAPSYFSGASRGSATPDYGVGPVQLDNKAPDRARRTPLNRRVAMYVSAYRDGMAPIDRADAVFTWDEDDGLENGEYIAYVGTYLPGLRDRVKSADDAIAEAVGGVNSTEQFEPTANVPLSNRAGQPNFGAGADPVVDALLGYETAPVGARRWNPNLQVEFITERVRARGIATSTNDGGLLPPALWQPGLTYQADDAGRIFYGAQSDGAWQPIIVRVTDNYLALRVRNASSSSTEVAAVSYVVLTPRKRVPGKINVNTAQFAQTTVGGNNQLFSSLLGLPGIVNDSSKLPPNDDIAPPQGPNNNGGWNPLETALSGVPVPPLPVPFPNAVDGLYNNPNDQIETLRNRATQLSGLIQAGRTNHADGRYYKSASALASDDAAYEYDPTTGATRIDTTGRTEALYPLSNSNLEETRFEEVERRYRRLANSITVRSDVFEIIATVQSGYGIDADGDGRFNYRSPDEFVTTAESKGRVVYERRASTDTGGVSGN